MPWLKFLLYCSLVVKEILSTGFEWVCCKIYFVTFPAKSPSTKLTYYSFYFIFLRKFQPMASAFDKSFLSSDQDTNRFLM